MGKITQERFVIVTADTNDGDYVTSRTPLSLGEKCGSVDLEALLRKVWKATQECTEHYNWPDSEYRDSNPYEVYEDILLMAEIDIFQEYFQPQSEIGIHTIESIQIVEGTVEEL